MTINTVEMTVDIVVGRDHELHLRTQVAEDVSRVYFTGTAVGAMKGLAAVTEKLLKMIPDDAPLDLRVEKAAITGD